MSAKVTSDPATAPAVSFAEFGVGQLVYVRPVEVDGAPAFAIRAADGSTIGVARRRFEAAAAARDLDLEVLSLH